MEALWVYLQMPEKERKIVLNNLDVTAQGRFENIIPQGCRNISEEEIKPFEQVMGEIMKGLLLEASEITCWVYEHKVGMEWTVDQMVHAFPEGEKFIRIIDACIEGYNN